MIRYLLLALVFLPGCDDTEENRRHIEQFGALEHAIHDMEERKSESQFRIVYLEDEALDETP